MDLGSYHEGMADKKKPRRYCAHCGNPIKEKGPLITERRWYHNECLPNELMLQMMFRPAHDPGAPVTEVELEELCRWMTSSGDKTSGSHPQGSDERTDCCAGKAHARQLVLCSHPGG